MEPQEILTRYIHEVGRRLPPKMRADVETELRSLLEDAVEERAAGRTPDEDLMVTILRDFGEPGAVADRYKPAAQYLIGPALYPTFVMVLKIIFCVWLGISLLGLFTGFSQASAPSTIFFNAFEDLMSYGFINFALVVIVFAVLDRFGIGRETTQPNWDPRQLPEVKDPDRIQRGEMIGSIVFIFLILVLFNAFPNWISYLTITDGEWGKVTWLAPEFGVHLPWLSICWLLEIGLKLLVLREGRWQAVTRWAEFGLGLFDLVVLFRIIAGGPIVIVPILTSLIKAALVVVVIIAIIEAAVQLYRLLTRERIVRVPHWPTPSA